MADEAAVEEAEVGAEDEEGAAEEEEEEEEDEDGLRAAARSRAMAPGVFAFDLPPFVAAAAAAALAARAASTCAAMAADAAAASAALPAATTHSMHLRVFAGPFACVAEKADACSEREQAEHDFRPADEAAPGAEGEVEEAAGELAASVAPAGTVAAAALIVSAIL